MGFFCPLPYLREGRVKLCLDFRETPLAPKGCKRFLYPLSVLERGEGWNPGRISEKPDPKAGAGGFCPFPKEKEGRLKIGLLRVEWRCTMKPW